MFNNKEEEIVANVNSWNSNSISINFINDSNIMKKTRVIRALKNCKSTDFKADSVLSFKDEKGKEYFLAEQPHYMNIITNSINVMLNRTFDIIR
jgi:hypothetical protein